MPRTPSPFSTGKRLCRVLSASVRPALTGESASSVVTSGRGVMMSRVRLAWRPKTPSSMSASSGSIAPPSSLWAIRICRSSGVEASSLSVAGCTPSARTSALPAPFMT